MSTAQEFVSHSPEETRQLGARLGRLLAPGDVLLVEGQLGAGKTVFAQGVASGLAVRDPVTSPTFTIIHEYAGRLPFFHVDLYRVAGEADAAAVGLEDYLADSGVVLVEWPDRAAGVMPADHLSVSLTFSEPGGPRLIRMRAGGARAAALLRGLAAPDGES